LIKVWYPYLAARLIGDRSEIVDQVFIQPDGDSHFFRFWRWLCHDSTPPTLAEIVPILHRCAHTLFAFGPPAVRAATIRMFSPL
jgi:hypothetical protein